MLASLKPEENITPQEPAFKHLISLGAFNGISFAILFCFVLIIGGVELKNIQTTEDLAKSIQQERIPFFVESSKTLINIESLRGLANVAYVSDDPLMRRKARVNAFALSTESLFEVDANFRDSARDIANKIKELTSSKDDVDRLRKDLDDLAKRYSEMVHKLIFWAGEKNQENTAHKLQEASLIALGQDSFTGTDLESATNAVGISLVLLSEVIADIKKERPHLAEELIFLQKQSEELAEEFKKILKKILAEQEMAQSLALNIDIELRTIRDKVSLGSEVAFSKDLESIQATAKSARFSSMVFYFGLFVAFLAYYLVVPFFISKPLRWTSSKLSAIQDGNPDIPTPKIYIKEIALLASLLDRFSVHLAELYSHANQLEEDAAEKKDIEELMHTVFKASLDGYVVWRPNEIERISQGLPDLLGFSNAADMLANWRIFDRSEKSLRLIFNNAIERESLREELHLTTCFGRILPVEVTHLPIKFHGEQCVLSYIRDLTTQKMHEEALLFAKDQAEVATKAKSEFLARMSHEIRTPMNGVLGLTHIALESNPAPKQQELLTKIQSSAKVLLGVINDILDFSKIEEGKLELEEKPFVIPQVFVTIKDLLESQAEKKGLRFVLEYDEPALNSKVVLGDSLRLTQVLLNLCGNGIKFTDVGTVVLHADVLPVSDGKLGVRFAVSDSGIGLTTEQMGKVFQPFVQVDTSSTRKYGGTGLGLMISKLLVELMGGNLEVQSVAGQGSAFFFTVFFELACAECEDPTLPKAADQALDFVGKRVLVAEDNEINQEIIQSLLESFNLAVTIANNGQEAVDMLAKNDFDMIFLDIQMPIMDGLTAAREIRSKGRESVRSLPIIAMTAHAMQEDVHKSLSVGMNDHLTKPIDISALRNCLTEFLTRK